MRKLSIQEIKRFHQIIDHTKKRRIKYKIIKRISDGTFDYFCQWLNDKEAHKTIDKKVASIKMPNSIELAKRYS